MAGTTAGNRAASTPTEWLRGLWEYYREYTHTAVHAIATAALTAFGLLVFVDQLFAAVAIAAYVVPPVVLYALDAGKPPASAPADRADAGTVPDGGGGDSDSDGDDGDTDSDGPDGDTDTDSDG